MFGSLFRRKKKNRHENALGLPHMVPGGMYPGIIRLAGDSDGEWTEGEEYGKCWACDTGKLTYYHQNNNYRLKCNHCGYLEDTGIQLIGEELPNIEVGTTCELVEWARKHLETMETAYRQEDDD